MALGALLPLVACGRGAGDQDVGISRQEYVETYIEILQAAEVAEDSVAATEAARAILARRGLTEDDLLEFGRRHSEDPEYLAELWEEIEERIRDPERPDSAREQGGREVRGTRTPSSEPRRMVDELPL
ncbi:MAG: hypothetical protein GTO46_02715 [Gemmatimonadetes bacterium]|nr:hypothetical protein [Gemmatimonadota bacterium]NIO30694.1 hypothetical protein [Gemmatimonadota bacterium]